MFVEYRQPLDSHCDLGQHHKHHVHEDEVKRSQVELSVLHAVGLQGGAKEHGHGDERYDSGLGDFEDVVSLVSDHQYCLPVHACLEELQVGERVAFVCKGIWVGVSGSIERSG